MKTSVYDLQGNKKKEIELPKIFESVVREDLVKKCVEAFREFQPHSLDHRAGRRHSASGIISHKRHDWKGQYGKGISRVPRKIIWRRGVQFNWVGAEVSGTRGGRRPHGHKLINYVKRINNKEIRKAIESAIASTGKIDYVGKRYNFDNKINLPLVLDFNKGDTKTKEFMNFLHKIFGENYERFVRKKDIRAGKGKSRGRRNKTSAGILLICGNGEEVKIGGVEIRKIGDIEIGDLYPLGRIAIYTEKALEEMK